MAEKRKLKNTEEKGNDIPLDYSRMVKEVIGRNFENGLKLLAKRLESPEIHVNGKIYPDEIVLSVSIGSPKKLWANTFHASSDFDPKASSPKADEVLGVCLDGIGAILSHYLLDAKPEKMNDLVTESTALMNDAPLTWTEFEVAKKTVFIKADKTNPSLDQITDQWLMENDPEAFDALSAEEKEAENLFVTGSRQSSNDSGNEPGDDDRTD